MLGGALPDLHPAALDIRTHRGGESGRAAGLDPDLDSVQVEGNESPDANNGDVEQPHPGSNRGFGHVEMGRQARDVGVSLHRCPLDEYAIGHTSCLSMTMYYLGSLHLSTHPDRHAGIVAENRTPDDIPEGGLSILLGFAADLSSVPDLEALSPGQWILWRERLAGLPYPLWTHDASQADVENALRDLHRWLGEVLVPLVDQPRLRAFPNTKMAAHFFETFGMVPTDFPEASAYLRKLLVNDSSWRIFVTANGAITLEPESLPGNEPPASRLQALLQGFLQPGRILPFARCPACQRIFVVTKRPQTYCSPTCLVAATRDRRRDQVREAGRRYRDRRKKTAKKKGAG